MHQAGLWNLARLHVIDDDDKDDNDVMLTWIDQVKAGQLGVGSLQAGQL